MLMKCEMRNSLDVFIGLLTVIATIATPAIGQVATGLFVCGRDSNNVVRYDATTGAFLGVFASHPNLIGSQGLLFGPDGHMYVIGEFSGNIFRFDGQTGASLGPFVPAGHGLSLPHSMQFGPDGHLYVCNIGTNDVRRYHGTSGAQLGVFASGNGLNIPLAITFGPDQNLYVSNGGSNNVLRFNGTTGAFMGVFASGGGMNGPNGIVFGRDGDLYVANNAFGVGTEVLRFDGATGVFIGVFASDPGLQGANNLAWHVNGDLYVSSFSNNKVLRFNGTTGALVGEFASGGGLNKATSLIFDPCTADADVDTVADCNDVCPGSDDLSDADSDGLADGCDNCPNHANADQADCDGDGVGDVCEIANGTQMDCNGNGVPDSCEIAAAGGALRFDGADDLAQIIDPFDPVDYTIEAWVRPADVTGVSIIHRTNNVDPASVFSHQLRITRQRTFEHYLYDGAAKSVAGTTVVQPDQWYHVAGVATANGVMRLYVNGVEEGTPTAIGTPETIGDRYRIGSSTGDSMGYYNGEVAQVRLWNYARSDAEVLADHDRAVDRDSAGLIGYWVFREAAGEQVLTDSSPAGKHGTLGLNTNVAANDPLRVSISPPLINDNDCNRNGVPDSCEPDSDGDGVIDDCDNCPGAPNPSQGDCDGNGTGDACESGGGDCNGNGVPDGCDLAATDYSGGALRFDGVDDVARVFDGENLTTYTIESWVMPSAIGPTGQSIIVRTNEEGTLVRWSHQLRILADGRFEHYLYDGSPKSVTGTTVASVGQWYHVAGVATAGSVMRLFVNGVEEGVPTAIASPETVGDRYIIAGPTGDAMGYFNGEVDEIRIWGVARTAAELLADYRFVVSSGSVGLRRHFRMNESSTDQTLMDFTTNNMHGTLGASISPESADPTRVASSVPFLNPQDLDENGVLDACAGAPEIATHPSNTVACNGGQATFSVVAIGAPPLSYQWRKGGVNIGGATGDTLTINSVSPGDAGSYDVVVTNSSGSTTSNAATLAVATAPAISQGPQGQASCAGGSATFSVEASGTGPLSYQWRKNSVSISGATGTSLTIDPVAGGDAGSYDVVVTNACGSTTSAAAELAVNPSPEILIHPQDRIARPGQSVPFSVSATGAPGLTYQWRRNGTPITGATGVNYYVYPAQPGDSGQYDVVVSSSNGCQAISVAATLLVEDGCQPCDTDCNGTVNQFDIDPFIQAMLTHSGCAPCSGDTNLNGTVNQFDIVPFVECLVH